MPPKSTEDLEGPRAVIFACVRDCPGIHLRLIERRTGFALGQVIHHADRLQRMGYLSSSRDGGFRRYYPTGEVGHPEKPVLAALRHTTPRRIILALLRSPGEPHKQIQNSLQVAGSTLSFHLQRLVENGVIVRERDGVVTRYRVADPACAIEQLVSYQGSFRDAEVQRFVHGFARGAAGGKVLREVATGQAQSVQVAD